MRSLVMISCFLLATSISGCDLVDRARGNTPEASVVAWVTAFWGDDYDAFVSSTHPMFIKAESEFRNRERFHELVAANINKTGGMKGVDVIGVEVAGARALVSTRVHYFKNNSAAQEWGSQDWELRKEAGKWKVYGKPCVEYNENRVGLAWKMYPKSDCSLVQRPDPANR